MKLGILADVHSNLPALELILKDAKQEQIDKWVSLGDNIGYLTNSNEVMDIIWEITEIRVPGNHEDVLYTMLTQKTIRHFEMNSVAHTALEWTKKNLSQKNKKRIIELVESPPILTGENFGLPANLLSFTHTTPEYSQSISKNTRTKMETERYLKNKNNQTKHTFIGHKHDAQIYYMKNETTIEGGYEFRNYQQNLSQFQKTLIVVPSAGHIRDGTETTGYAIFDTINQELTIKRLPINFFDILFESNEKIRKSFPIKKKLNPKKTNHLLNSLL